MAEGLLTKSEGLSAAELVARAQDLSSLPESAQRVVEIVSDSGTDAADLQEVIAHDPPLTAKLLRLVNSAYYGFAEPVADIRRAIVILGFNTVRSLALSVSVCEMFQGGDAIGSYSRRGLWEHSVAVGVAAKMICRRFAASPGEEGFVAGIVHDVGMILEDQYAHETFVRALLTGQHTGTELWAVERKLSGTDHAEVGQQLATKWRFPASVAEAVGAHHRPSFAKHASKLPHVLHVADVLAYAKNIGCASAITASFDVESFKALGLSRSDFVVILQELDEALSKAQEFLAI
jgi:putative nucleotidyltransferase with HDIG domain